MRFRFSGHESFPCRFPWLPKAYKSINQNPNLFGDDNDAMVQLGVGKNMVKSIRFWVQAFGVAKPIENTTGLEITFFGDMLFGDNGLDLFLEDIRTLWLLHWKISTIAEDPLFSWYYLLNQWLEPTFSRSEIINAFTKETERLERPLSAFTKEQHFDIFLHTYLPVRARKEGVVLEDTLDCPLTELGLISSAGERIVSDSGKWEPVYEFRQGAKQEITPALFIYCLFDFWRNNRYQEATLSFRDISTVHGSIGQIFKLSEPDVRNRLESLSNDSGGMFEYISSASIPRVIKFCSLDQDTELLLISRIFE